jgi:hypothetical protein
MTDTYAMSEYVNIFMPSSWNKIYLAFRQKKKELKFLCRILFIRASKINCSSSQKVYIYLTYF